MKNPLRLLCLAAAAMLGSAHAAAAQNLLSNPGFDASLARWSQQPSPFVTVALVDDDLTGSCGSNAARITVTDSSVAGSLGQCVPVTGATAYDAGVWARSEPGNTVLNVASVVVEWFAAPGCAGGPLDSSDAISLAFPGRYFPLRLTATSPAAAQSARLSFLTGAPDAGTVPVTFDEAAFCRSGTCGLSQAAELAPLEFPDFRFRVLVVGGDDDVSGTLEPAASCLAETACVSGALPGRTEVMLRVIGPRPNGFLWFQAVRFTPSRVVIEARQVSTSIVRHYLLPETGDERPISVEDRMAFPVAED
jgi:hypothetical protein